MIEQLRERLERDADGRLYVDAFLLTHPDKDHILGLAEHFHLGPPSEWSEKADKILIREMWSSPIVFRRASRTHTLCDDACAWSAEARRRVRLFEEEGPRRARRHDLILGEDIDGKTDDLGEILVKAGESFAVIANEDGAFQANLLAPMLADDDAEAEELSKNNSSVIMVLELQGDGVAAAARYLIGGDAEVAVWERMRGKYGDDDLAYDILIAPHHCSWHSLSHDSWSDYGENAEVSEGARSALAQANAQRGSSRAARPSRTTTAIRPAPGRARVPLHPERCGRRLHLHRRPAGRRPLRDRGHLGRPQAQARPGGGHRRRGHRARHAAGGPRVTEAVPNGPRPSPVTRALRAAEAHPAVKGIEWTPDDGRGFAEAVLSIDTNLPSRWLARGHSDNGVRAVEPVRVIFGKRFPWSAPTFFLREDFDRSHPHCNRAARRPPEPVSSSAPRPS